MIVPNCEALLMAHLMWAFRASCRVSNKFIDQSAKLFESFVSKISGDGLYKCVRIAGRVNFYRWAYSKKYQKGEEREEEEKKKKQKYKN